MPAPDGVSEIPRAYVVRKPGHAAVESEIKAFLLTRLARYKVGDCEIRFCDAVPHSPSGKILRKVLRAEATKEAMDHAVAGSLAEADDAASRSSRALTTRMRVRNLGVLSVFALVVFHICGYVSYNRCFPHGLSWYGCQ